MSVKLAEAASHGLPITQYATRSVGYEDYQALANEVLRDEAPIAPVKQPVGEEGLMAEQAPIDDIVSPPPSIEEPVSASAPYETSEGVRFTFEAPDAVSVQLAGDFNEWTPEEGEMELLGGVWVKTLILPPGRYRYRYVVDGRWQNDPLNPSVEPSPYGGHDSLVELNEPLTLEWVLPGTDGDGSA